jgi:hypothetical protein
VSISLLSPFSIYIENLSFASAAWSTFASSMIYPIPSASMLAPEEASADAWEISISDMIALLQSYDVDLKPYYQQVIKGHKGLWVFDMGFTEESSAKRTTELLFKLTVRNLESRRKKYRQGVFGEKAVFCILISNDQRYFLNALWRNQAFTPLPKIVFCGHLAGFPYNCALCDESNALLGQG